jgi:hypothetical protein
LRQEGTEPGHGRDVVHDGADREAGAQPESAPAFDQRAQPWLGQPVEPQVVASLGRVAGVQGQAGQGVQAPDVPGVLDVPAGAVPQVLDHVVGVQQETLIPAARLAAAQLAPSRLVVVEQ